MKYASDKVMFLIKKYYGAITVLLIASSYIFLGLYIAGYFEIPKIR